MADQIEYGCSHCNFVSNVKRKVEAHVKESNEKGGFFVCPCEEFEACFYEQLADRGGHFNGHYNECEAYEFLIRTNYPHGVNVVELEENCDCDADRKEQDAQVVEMIDKDEGVESTEQDGVHEEQEAISGAQDTNAQIPARVSLPGARYDSRDLLEPLRTDSWCRDYRWCGAKLLHWFCIRDLE